jgi:hypothetical protein
VKEVADLLKTVKAGMSDCSHIKADWEKLEEMAAIFENPTSFAYHVGKDLLINGVDIFNEIKSAVDDYEAGQWSDFGFQVGEAAAKIIIGEESKAQLAASKKNELAEIFQGLMEAFGAHIDIYALLICIREEDQAVLMFDLAAKMIAQAIKTKDFQPLIGAVIGIVGGVQQFKKGLPACEAVVGHEFAFQQLDQCMDVAAYPLQNMEILEHDVKINGKSILKDAEAAAAAYESGDFVGFGKNLGQILKLATEEVDVNQAVLAKEDDRTAVAQVAQGFLEAMKVGTFNFTNLLICIY